MAKMYGDRGREQWDSPDNKTKSTLKHREERQWRKEAALEELVNGECPHVASTREDVEGLKACNSCVNPEDLEGIEGVTFGQR